MNKKIFASIVIGSLLSFGIFAYAQTLGGVTIPQGGTGLTNVPANYVLMGSSTLHLTAVATSSLGIATPPTGLTGSLQYNNGGVFGATSSPVVGYITATSTTGTSTFAGPLQAPIIDVGGQVFNVMAYGAKGNGSTDDSTAVKNAIKAAQVNGGTVFFPAGNYLINSKLEFPIADNWVTGNAYAVGDYTYVDMKAYQCLVSHTSGTFATDLGNGKWSQYVHTRPIRLEGVTTSYVGWGTDQQPYATTLPTGGSILTLNAVDIYGKLDFRGLGYVEIDHLAMTDTTDGTSPFIFGLNSIMNIHDNVFWGKTAATFSLNTGYPSPSTMLTIPVQDAIIFGGTTTTPYVGLGGNDPSHGFTGWGSTITSNFFDRFRRSLYMRSTANNVFITKNTMWDGSGSIDGTPAIEVDGLVGTGGTAGLTISDNAFDLYRYPTGSGIKLSNVSNVTMSGNGCEDNDATGTSCYLFSSSAFHNTLIGGNYVVSSTAFPYTDNEQFLHSNTIIMSLATTTISGQYGFQVTQQYATTSPITVPAGKNVVGIENDNPNNNFVLDAGGDINIKKSVNTGYYINSVTGLVSSTTLNNWSIAGSIISSNSTGTNNLQIGQFSLLNNTTGNNNVSIGGYSMENNTTGLRNVSVGYNAMPSNTIGSYNTVVGAYAMPNFNMLTTSHGNNTVIGYLTGGGIVTGERNTIIGANVSGLSSTLSNNIILADGAGNQRLNIDSTGNVGIGTTSPSAKFSIHDSSGLAGTNPLFTIASSTSGGAATTTLFTVLGNGSIFTNNLQGISTTSVSTYLKDLTTTCTRTETITNGLITGLTITGAGCP